jgi:hypothetical protein
MAEVGENANFSIPGGGGTLSVLAKRALSL